MSTISVVLATYNEEANIGQCLESIKDLADEIVIVDGNSEDKTVEIARSFGAKVFITENNPNFHINKQKAIDKATKDWILQLDADERVSVELIEEIKDKINDQKKAINGYWVPRKNWFLGRFLLKGGQYPDYTLRLYKRGKGSLPQKDVHEQAVVDGEVGYLTQPLLHYPYRNFLHYLSKWKRYSVFIAHQLRKEKNIFDPFLALNNLIILPIYWFLMTYIRHKGFMDSWQGFVFSVFSALRFPASYLIALFAKA
jgi:glycosyltransferase involved in cell wall biosynthesis